MSINDDSTGQRLATDAGAAEPRLLVEVNEQLVLAALQAQVQAETVGKALDETSHLAQFDALTGLPNRVLLLDRFVQAIANARRRAARLALLFLDLDRFKQINDTLGHAVGDDMLRITAQCLSAAVRDADTVSRYGGDEFVILLPEVSQRSDARLVIDKIHAALAAASAETQALLPLTVSIGISVYPDDGDVAETLIDRADAAMYRAKQYRVGSFAFHGQPPEGERSGAYPPSSRSPDATAHHEEQSAHDAGSEHARRSADQREAIEQLLLAALNAQERQSSAEGRMRDLTQLVANLRHRRG